MLLSGNHVRGHVCLVNVTIEVQEQNGDGLALMAGVERVMRRSVIL